MTNVPASPPPFRLPTAGPSPSDLADRDAWETAAEGSLASVQSAAEKWRAGLAAFVTLVTGGLLVKGPEAAKDLPTGWLLTVTVVGGLGLLLAVVGLWQALRAAAGNPAGLRYEDISLRYGSFRQYQVASAKQAATTLASARWFVAGSLICLGLTVILWWWTPTNVDHLIKVAHGKEASCGELQSADGGQLVVKVAGAPKSATIKFTDVDNISVVDEC